MKKFRKILSLTLCLSLVMACTLVPTQASASTDVDYIFYDDLETGETVGATESTKWQKKTYRGGMYVASETIEDDTNTFVRITRGEGGDESTGTASQRPLIMTKDALSIPYAKGTGKLVIETDLRASTTTYRNMLRVNINEHGGEYGYATSSENQNLKTLFYTDENDLVFLVGQYIGASTLGLPYYYTVENVFNANTWYTIKSVIDLDNDTIEHYLNGTPVASSDNSAAGKYITTANGWKDIENITDISFAMGFPTSQYDVVSASTLDFDNFKIYTINGRPEATLTTNTSVANPVFTLTFDKAMDADTLNATTVKLYKGTTEVNYTPNYNATTKTYTLTPASGVFALGDAYQIKLTDGVYAANESAFREEGKLTGGAEFEGFVGYTTGATHFSDDLTDDTADAAPINWELKNPNPHRNTLKVRAEADGNKYLRVTRGESDDGNAVNEAARPHVQNKTAFSIPFANGTGKLVIEAKLRANKLDYSYMLRVLDAATVPGYAYSLTGGLYDAGARYALVKTTPAGKLCGMDSGQTHPAFRELGNFSAGTTWYSVKCVIDLETRLIQYYINNAFAGEGEISNSEDMANITNITNLGFSMGYDGGTPLLTAATMDIDDVAVYSLNRAVPSQTEITYNHTALTSDSTLTPHVTWINNTGAAADIRVYSVLYKKSGNVLLMEDVVMGDAVTVAADATYDAYGKALSIPEFGGNDYIVKTYVWTTSLVPVIEQPGSLD